MSPPRAQRLGVAACHLCTLVSDAPSNAHARCPRCGARLHSRKPASRSRTFALLCAAILFYLPANLLPVMRTSQFGHAVDSTILSGVMAFWQAGEWDIALVIFIASIVIPCAKFLALGWLMWTTRRKHTLGRKQRTLLYRAVEFIGYWSMLDVLVVGLVCALVRFDLLGRIEPQPGIAFFGAVVMLTMLSASHFDPRLIWDDPEHD
ncbi:MAG: paraquat-inducible protein A [Paludibacterium sp.]|uniref:paraquat-inducible protein A n=1 Tax=Paludibacterium sp. TaxID=1917523 RepID=UPI0025E54EE4|nr:paraquat-inducible protein A [Paludibacterium sp.]MBV8046852.1 paraquat-inducible protein A [Paludibacterium sp.]MBV8646835.1 paraquat-inducible protein A [Paludibacterium sp.]